MTKRIPIYRDSVTGLLSEFKEPDSLDGTLYQKWLDLGNVGTIEDFLNTLDHKPNVFFQVGTTPTQESQADSTQPYLVYTVDGDSVIPFMWEPE